MKRRSACRSAGTGIGGDAAVTLMEKVAAAAARPKRPELCLMTMKQVCVFHGALELAVLSMQLQMVASAMTCSSVVHPHMSWQAICM